MQLLEVQWDYYIIMHTKVNTSWDQEWKRNYLLNYGLQLKILLISDPKSLPEF